MRVLEISTAMDCPMRCDFCPQEAAVAGYRGPRLMTVDTFIRAVENAQPVGQISFAGFAEPFLNPLTAVMVEHARTAAPSVVMYTTGVGMKLADVATMTRCGLDWITLHLPDAAGAMKVNITPAYWIAIEALMSSGIQVRPMAMGPIHPEFEGLFRGVRVGGNESMQSRAGHVELMQAPGINPDRFVKMAHRGRLGCRAAPELDHPVLLPSGELVLCCQDWALEHVLGNLADRRWDDIYSGEAFSAVKSGMADGDVLCRGCEYAVVK
jgi:hypothetical protein